MTRGRPNPPLSEAVIKQFSRRSPSGCLLWTGSVNREGYARYRVGGKSVRVHRWVLANAGVTFPDDWTVDHQCHDPTRCKRRSKCPHRRCVEPTHLKAMPGGENAMRGGGPMAAKARQTECVHKHPLSGENLYVTPDGRRQCRECRRRAVARHKKRGKRH